MSTVSTRFRDFFLPFSLYREIGLTCSSSTPSNPYGSRAEACQPLWAVCAAWQGWPATDLRTGDTALALLDRDSGRGIGHLVIYGARRLVSGRDMIRFHENHARRIRLDNRDAYSRMRERHRPGSPVLERWRRAGSKPFSRCDPPAHGRLPAIGGARFFCIAWPWPPVFPPTIARRPVRRVFPLLARRSGTPARAWSPGRAFPFSPHSHLRRVRERRPRRAIPLRSLHPAVGNDGACRGPFFAPCRPRQRTRRFLAAVGTHTGGWRDDRSAVRKLSQTAQRPGRRPDTRDAGPVFSCSRTHTGGRVNVSRPPSCYRAGGADGAAADSFTAIRPHQRTGCDPDRAVPCFLPAQLRFGAPG